MELYQLEYFRTLCKYGNYTQAAAELNITQPALSMSIKHLEKEFGDIINRQAKSFTLTEKGEALLNWATVIHNDITNLRSELNTITRESRELLRLAMPIPLVPEVLAKVIPEFSYSHANATLNILQEGHTAIVTGLMSRKIDIGIVCKEMTNSLLSYVPYKKVEYCACFSPEHHFNDCEYITPDMLMEEKLYISSIQNTMTAAIQTYMTGYENPPIHYINAYPDSISSLGHDGAGIVFFPKHACPAHSAPLNPPLFGELVIAWRKDDPLSTLQQEFINAILVHKNTA
ncbi:MAG: LysR family transcriptional regulator [Lachnospiraceae bacterium]